MLPYPLKAMLLIRHFERKGGWGGTWGREKNITNLGEIRFDLIGQGLATSFKMVSAAGVDNYSKVGGPPQIATASPIKKEGGLILKLRWV